MMVPVHPDSALQPEMPAGEALCAILRQLLAGMERNLAGAVAGRDPEFLHDLRVAVRRTRSLLGQVKGVLPRQVARHFRPDFKWLGEITGPTRDLDVYLLKLPGYQASLPESLQGDLLPLHDFLVRHQRVEQRQMARRLGSARCRELLDEWREFLAASRVDCVWPEQARRPILGIANREIRKTYRRVIRQGVAIDSAAPATALHELRINGKKLRYLLEFFQDLYPSSVIGTQIKALKGLQDNLGDFQDLEVQGTALRRFARLMQEEQGSLSQGTQLAIQTLIENLERRKQLERIRFADCFARFASSENQRLCEELFTSSTNDKSAG